ncbi:3-deoxy-7-phosphoheptulonate synthase [Desulfatitalea alkaliphila]|uniref:Phospho-2-dehydro-3-deoxyheptonate aldolase n=1 Tax=Desulfatitalea alkaliphila TaxID=2929485 RepID=A0AA41R6P6_9BACT|nr:3-deoxy-7-phosphoheptulonate synthase [Desulfatitalea alkaliphila]MCJ8502716.1 3-deoxy-7-phosphoheptulonate synthase [Desulfatitalea alkaliphila]
MKTYDVRVREFTPLIAPDALKEELPINEASAETVMQGRKVIQEIITRKDPRLMVITGPCSIHDETAAMEYAERLAALQRKVADRLYLVMRVYFEKPRTTVGWKGLINDPHLDGSYDMVTGLKRARKLLSDITALGLPTATELLDPFIPQYIAGLVCWAAIGARTTESQTHREMASGLSMPVGFKNGTDGNLSVAINAMIAAASPQHFLGIDHNGKACLVTTTGNAYAHLVLRGGRRPNYDSCSIREVLDMLNAKKRAEAVVVDCSHANSHKRFEEQALVWKDVINQRAAGCDAIVGAMLESNLNEGQQKNTGDLRTMAYGVSITDACISWETTEELILWADDRLRPGS